MPDNKNIGVINEQGFVAGFGLGFSPIKENELQNNVPNEKEENPENDNE